MQSTRNLSPTSIKLKAVSDKKFLSSAFCDNLSNGKTRILYGQDIEDYKAIAVTALDPKKWDKLDEINGVGLFYLE